ncbi:uncharacterized protein L201_002132 [Kwoniella dendrophila CBS 6074]|uniref:Uncharacterized protein n=1 Tax=Kwoniella dendrophila CBS 6074 TaxID=1295534 RepID=A0AAX4JQW2_9TREE
MDFEIQVVPGLELSGRTRFENCARFVPHHDSKYNKEDTLTIECSSAPTPQSLQNHTALETSPLNLGGETLSLQRLMEEISEFTFNEDFLSLTLDRTSSPIIENKPEKATLTINTHIGSGYLWDFWLGDHSVWGKVILKLVNANYCSREDPEGEEIIAPGGILLEAIKEELLYLGPLSDLQGDLVPKYHGLYQSSGSTEYYAIILEFAGHPLEPEMVNSNEEWKQKLYLAYEQLHKRVFAAQP